MTELVKIKTWEQMSKEYGIVYDKDNNIKPRIQIRDCSFLKEMEDDLPENRVIEIEKNKTYGEFTWFAPDGSWSICDEMIEEYLDIENYPEYFIQF